MELKINEYLAKEISYGGKRDLEDVKFIVVHFTGNKGDTAKNNAKYFATTNVRPAGAHFFVDKNGEVWKSVHMNRVAYSVGGGLYTNADGAATYYGKCTNANSISIELCDCLDDVNWKQMLAVKQLVKHIQSKCPNAKTIIRHWDVNGKECPGSMTGRNNKKWKHLKNKIEHNYLYKAKVANKAAIRSSGKVKANNKIGTAAVGDIVEISKVVGKWGRLRKKKKGKWQWISLKKVKEM